MNVNLNHIRNSILEVEFTFWHFKETWHIQNLQHKFYDKTIHFDYYDFLYTSVILLIYFYRLY